MAKKKFISLLLLACIYLCSAYDAEAVGVIRPNIRIKEKSSAEQTSPVTNPKVEVKLQTDQESGKVFVGFNIEPKSKASRVKSQAKVAVQTASEVSKNSQLDAELAGMLGDKAYEVPGIGVIAYKNNTRIYENCLGRRYIWGDKSGDLPFSSDSRFRVGTVSQQILALAALQLVEQGKLDLDEDISKYIGFSLRNPASPEAKITVRMLMSHTSGLRDGQYAINQSWKDVFASGKGLFAPKDQKVGEYFHYANINYRILATALEKISATRFDLFMKNGILKDLHIKGGYNIADLKPKEQKLLGGIYQKQSNGVWNENGPWVLQMDDFMALKGHKANEFIEQPVISGKETWINLAGYEIGKNASIFVPECGLRASLEELSHMLEMIFNKGFYMNKQVLDDKLLDEMFRIQWFYDDWNKNGETYGGLFEACGLGVMPFFNGGTTRISTVKAHQWWGQIGDNYGAITGFVVDRRTKCGYVYIANGQAMNWTDARSKGKFSKHIIWQENINDAICRNLFKD